MSERRNEAKQGKGLEMKKVKRIKAQVVLDQHCYMFALLAVSS